MILSHLRVVKAISISALRAGATATGYATALPETATGDPAKSAGTEYDGHAAEQQHGQPSRPRRQFAE